MAIENKYGELVIDGIPVDEPVFLLRSQDALAVATLQFYKLLRESTGDVNGAEAIDLAIRRFKAWPKKKLPD